MPVTASPDKQRERIEARFSAREYIEAQATWEIYQRIATTCRELDKGKGQMIVQAVIDSTANVVPAGLVEIRKLGRMLQ